MIMINIKKLFFFFFSKEIFYFGLASVSWDLTSRKLGRSAANLRLSQLAYIRSFVREPKKTTILINTQNRETHICTQPTTRLTVSFSLCYKFYQSQAYISLAQIKLKKKHIFQSLCVLLSIPLFLFSRFSILDAFNPFTSPNLTFSL